MITTTSTPPSVCISTSSIFPSDAMTSKEAGAATSEPLKRCKKCSRYLPLSMFKPHNNAKDRPCWF